MSENKVKYNLKNCYYAVATFDSDGVPTYETPVRLPGAVELALDANGEPENFYADGIAYYVINNNMGYEGDLELAILPEAFREDVLGETDDTNHVLVETYEAQLKHFALLFEFDGDVKSTRHVLYNCTVSRPSVEGKTNEESKEIKTEKITLHATPLDSGAIKARTGSQTGNTVYNNWFSSVYMPSSDATLSALTVGSLTLSPTFASGTTTYTATRASTVTSSEITATATATAASVVLKLNGSAISGTTVTWTSAAAGDVLSIVVTNSGTVKTYTVTVTVAS